MAFKGTKKLNRIQSVVFETAYNTNENLLICAPTGAGKTNIAMLTIIHQIKHHIEAGVIKKDSFKVSLYLTFPRDRVWNAVISALSGASPHILCLLLIPYLW